MKQEIILPSRQIRPYRKIFFFLVVAFICTLKGYAQGIKDYEMIIGGFGLDAFGLSENRATVWGADAEFPLSDKLTFKAGIGKVFSASIVELTGIDGADDYEQNWKLDWDSDKPTLFFEAGLKYYKKEIHASHGWVLGAKLRYFQYHISGRHTPCYEWEYDRGTFLWWDYEGWYPVTSKENAFEMKEQQISLVISWGWYGVIAKRIVLGLNSDLGIGMVSHRSDTFESGIPEPDYKGYYGQHVTAAPSAEGYKESNDMVSLNLAFTFGYLLY
jgi:hypothetical protein